MNKYISKNQLIVAYLGLFYTAVLGGYISQLRLFKPKVNVTSVIASLMFFDRFIVEFLLMVLVCMWLIHKNKYCRAGAYILISLFFIVHAIQLTSVFIGGGVPFGNSYRKCFSHNPHTQ